jgi:hypothetical protein
MVDHTQITGIHDVGALGVLIDGEVLTRPLLLHQGILIAAGLGAGAPVGISACHIVGQEAAARIGYAHGPMGKDLQLQLLWSFFSDAYNLRKAQLPS